MSMGEIWLMNMNRATNCCRLVYIEYVVFVSTFCLKWKHPFGLWTNLNSSYHKNHHIFGNDFWMVPNINIYFQVLDLYVMLVPADLDMCSRFMLQNGISSQMWPWPWLSQVKISCLSPWRWRFMMRFTITMMSIIKLNSFDYVVRMKC